MNETARGPQFVAVGPEKTGTTWLHKLLDAHPDVQLPPVKEMRFFWEQDYYRTDTLWQRLTSPPGWHRRQFWRVAAMTLALPVLSPRQNLLQGRRKLKWCYRYVAKPHTNAWYLSCFDADFAGQSGEVSPQYFFLQPHRIDAIGKLIPDAKIIISLRRPRDWVWSFARMSARGGVLEKRYGSIAGFIDHYIENRSFSRSLGHWKRNFADEQLLVLFYDELVDNPWAYYTSVCHFLRIEPDPDQRERVHRRVNVGHEQTLPPEFEDKIRNGWRDDIRRLNEMLPNVPSGWLED